MWPGCLALVVAAWCAAPAAPALSPQTHGILRTIRSPLELARPCMPRRYVVPVELTGAMAEQIRGTLAEQGLEAPTYEERMDKGSFTLLLTNPSYTIDAREMVSGILNPPEMIDVVIRSAVRYRTPDMFSALVKETNISVAGGKRGGREVLTIDLTPKGKRFAYTYDDLGSHVRESWLEGLRVVMDTSDHLIHELVQSRCVRQYTMEQTSAPSPTSVVARYEFGYDSSSGHVLPASLKLSLNDSLVVTVTASYRTEGRYTVFDSRSICHVQGEGSTCLDMRYGRYAFVRAPAAAAARQKPSKAARQIERAAELSRKAAAELRAGRIANSFKLLQRLVDRHPHTPQATEARKVLENLPWGL